MSPWGFWEEIDKVVGRSIPAIIGYGVFVGSVTGAFDYTGGKLSGTPRNPDADRWAEKETERKTYRRPVEDTIAQLGERRGMDYEFSLWIRSDAFQVSKVRITKRGEGSY